MAYLKRIYRPRCPCGKLATHTLINRANAPDGDYCFRCAKREAAALNAAERTKGRNP